MKLIVLEIDINGTATALSDLGRPWTEEELGGSPDFQVIGDADIIPENYTDVSSVENWALYGPRQIGKFVAFRDWKNLRSEIKTLVLAITSDDIGTNFASLSDEEKKITCKYLINLVPTDRLIETYASASDRLALSLNFDKESTGARTQRYYVMRTVLMGKIGSVNGVLYLEDAIRESRVEAYLGGIESKEEDGVSGLYDFIDGTDIYVIASPATLKGLRHRSYSITDGSGDTLADVCDILLGIIKGLY